MVFSPVSHQFNTSEIRAFETGKVAWFVAGDVAAALGYSGIEDLVRILEEDEKGSHVIKTANGDQELITINEAGLYHTILECSQPYARSFRQWILGVVLPSIRGTARSDEKESETGLPDPEWLAEGRRKLLEWSEAVAAGKKVKFPELDDQTVAGMMGFALRHSRFLVTIGDDGKIRASTVPINACVMTMGQFLKALNEPNGLHVETKVLIEFVQAATNRLAERFDYYEARNRKPAD